MIWVLGQYYAAFIAVIFLARGLGLLFFVPLVVNFAFELCLDWGVFTGWDIRLLMAGYGFAIFLWVLALAGSLRKSTFVVMLVLDMAVMVNGMWPFIQAAGTGQDFWSRTSTSILDVWQTSILVVVISMIIRSTVVAKARGEYIDLLTNPKKRFLLPIGAWALIQELPKYLHPIMPGWLFAHRFQIAAVALVWGWIALELPFYLMYRRLKKQYS